MRRVLERVAWAGGRRAQRRTGFTLVEILVVLAIISVLAGLITVSVQQARKFANIKTTRIDIQQLEQAALVYRNAFGDYPPTSLSSSSEVKGIVTNGVNDGIESLLIHLVRRDKGGPFLEDTPDHRLENHDVDKLTSKQLATLKKSFTLTWNTPALLEYCDLWGNPFVYVHHRDYAQTKKAAYQGMNGQRVYVDPPKSEKTGTYHKPTTFQIWSFGPNGINENGDGDDITSWGL